MSDRQRRYRERLKAGRRLFIVELDEVDAEELVLGMGLNAENIGRRSRRGPPDVAGALRVTPPCSRLCFDVCSKNESAGAENHVQRVANSQKTRRRSSSGSPRAPTEADAHG